VLMDPLPLLAESVDPADYFARYPEAARRGIDAFRHYDQYGWRAGLDPNPWFSTSKYLARYPDVADADVNPLTHYLAHGFYEGRIAEPPGPDRKNYGVLESGDDEAVRFARAVGAQFDRTFYRGQLSARGLSAAGLGEVEHYRRFGVKYGLDPNPGFSTTRYLGENPDVAAAGVHPFVHYVTQGRAEGRAAPSPTAVARDEQGLGLELMASEFDAQFYADAYPDVVQAGVDPLVHFATEGWREGRNPNGSFTTKEYLDANPDVRQAGINPFLHYVTRGRVEGRLPKQSLGFRYDLIMSSEPVEEQVAAVRRRAVTEPRATSAALQRAMQLFGRSDSRRLYLSVSHDDYTANMGGVQLCLQREAEAFRKQGYDHIHLYPVVPLPTVETENRDYLVGVLLNDLKVGVFEATTLNGAIRELCASADVFAERLFAIHSLLGHNGHAIVSIVKAIPGAKGFFWVHDYASACAGYNLLRNDAEYCGAPPPESLACTVCTYAAMRRAQVAEHEWLFDQLELNVVAPSETALQTWQSTTDYPHLSAQVLEHCTLVPRVTSSAVQARRRDRKLRVAYLGFPAPKKGWIVYKELANAFSRDPRYEFYHLGTNQQSGVPLRFVKVEVGAATSNEMSRAVEDADIDVVVLWSVCRETFCFTAYEAVAGGAAVITSVESGNAAQFVTAEKRGVALRDERQLHDMFRSGVVASFARSRRRVEAFSLKYSAMTATFLNRALV
jgi:hypothetical protein